MDLKARLSDLHDQCVALNKMWKAGREYFGFIEFKLKEMMHWCDCSNNTFVEAESYDDFVEELDLISLAADYGVALASGSKDKQILEKANEIKTRLKRLLNDILWEQTELYYKQKTQ